MKWLIMVYSVILNGLLGFVWIIFISKLLDLFNSSGKSIWMGLFIGVATLLFLDITTRVFESFDKDKRHPVRIAGYVSFGIVVLVSIFIIKSS
ncbi:hypothetical protein ACFFF5_05925 [Lederbergia wuyishanensis]|uniref:Uncharacterized protein n=1 Tax=Lederbergia wuyishanensis TaxID=1347903 RepID=A0ABU0CYL7_9BACI|nr:hypothetical protein [Lederbergia wuyishanensis]MCJ8005878.1 hypothetical protein [Lederbergia wuyishanensis]MDQ0341243.1 hypothetical protein [Lederbergia wuyishanensis]